MFYILDSFRDFQRFHSFSENSQLFAEISKLFRDFIAFQRFHSFLEISQLLEMSKLFGDFIDFTAFKRFRLIYRVPKKVSKIFKEI